ncbi:hypothetical protein [Streptomyces lydicus]|uniref:hypothetical protein n=1 Tax=Streptomyces lydicus TaxID=47763 RepID=UPI00101257A3|nr:hypothetical protein [Streptomyces lydicus]MCZ1006541.1 hypothetical protein [Streptomyces lydicus]
MIIAELLGELVSGGEEVHLVSGAEQPLESEVDGIRLGALTVLPDGDERFPQELELLPLHFRRACSALWRRSSSWRRASSSSRFLVT